MVSQHRLVLEEEAGKPSWGWSSGRVGRRKGAEGVGGRVPQSEAIGTSALSQVVSFVGGWCLFRRLE